MDRILHSVCAFSNMNVWRYYGFIYTLPGVFAGLKTPADAVERAFAKAHTIVFFSFSS